jgi:hypothetical protein
MPAAVHVNPMIPVDGAQLAGLDRRGDHSPVRGPSSLPPRDRFVPVPAHAPVVTELTRL